MTVTLRPKHERMIGQALQSGAYQSADEVIERALEILSLEDQLLTEDNAATDAKIRRGIEQLDRGEGIPGELSRARLQEKKAAWLKTNNPDA